LCTLIEKCWAEGNTLFVTFVDITNAFPSTDHSLLWLTLKELNLMGQYFDWIRALYCHMHYKVVHDGYASEELKLLCGVLISDPLSPLLWNIFMSTLHLTPGVDDIQIFKQVINHLEHTDDIVLASSSPDRLQSHLNQLHDWCKSRRLLINAIKMKILIFGPQPQPEPTFFLNGAPLSLEMQYKYIRITFRSSKHDIFEQHYVVKADAANASSQCLSGSEHLCGCGNVPPAVVRMLYTALIDCHLIQ
jgi:hypothetical protein